MEADDAELLCRYAETRDENAFAELVQRYLNLVYFAALRQVGGDAHRAEDVAQSVFTLLARKASSLTRHQTLAGWLHTTTRFAASEALRTERRRLAREEEAHTMHELSTDPAAPADWERLRPIIDEALNELGDADREAVLLRFFADQPLAAIGAKLQVSENAARMRVDRALEKLHALLTQRGVTSTTAALAVVFANQAVAVAPAGLAASVTSAALAGSAAAGSGGVAAAKLFGFMSTTKITVGIVGALAVGATAITWQQQEANTALRREIAALRQQQTSAVVALREDNERLLAERKAEADTARVEHAELVRMRAEREAYLKAVIAKRVAAAHTGGEPPTGGAPAENGGLAPGMVSVEHMTNVGRATPSAVGQTLAWALRQADFKAAAETLTFDAPEREKLEALIATLPENSRAAFGTPEQIVALVMAGSPKPIVGAQVLNRSLPDADTEIARVQWQYQTGEMHEEELKFRREADGWKQVVSPALADRVIAYIKGKQ